MRKDLKVLREWAMRLLLGAKSISCSGNSKRKSSGLGVGLIA